MAARHRKQLEAMSAPVIAWLIAMGYVENEGGVLEVTRWGDRLHEARIIAIRETQGMKPVRVPA